ncbi:Transcription factor lbx1 [Sparganum proliferum]
MTSISSSNSSDRRNSHTAFSIHHLLGDQESAGEAGCNQSDCTMASEVARGTDKVTSPACEVVEVHKAHSRDSDLMHILEESLSLQAVGRDSDRLRNVLQMLSSFIANLSSLRQNFSLAPASSQRPLTLAQIPAFFTVKPTHTESDRVGPSRDPDQSASPEAGWELKEQESQSDIAGGALSSLINMTFSKMLTLAEVRTLKDQVLKTQGSVPPVIQLNTNKLRKTRTTFTTSQLAQLEVYFGRQKYLTPADRDHIAGELGLSSAQVITWFQNRRAKNRRERLELEKDILVSRRKKHFRNAPLRVTDAYPGQTFAECQSNPDSEGGLSADRTAFPGSMLL